MNILRRALRNEAKRRKQGQRNGQPYGLYCLFQMNHLVSVVVTTYVSGLRFQSDFWVEPKTCDRTPKTAFP
jgi:hypothetical protein